MTNDPLNRHQSMMREAKAPDHLPDKVLQQVRAQANDYHKSPVKETEGASPMENLNPSPVAPTFSVKRRRVAGFAIAACAVLVLGAGALAFAPIGQSLTPNDTQGNQVNSTIPSPFDFTVKAYADSTNTLLSFGTDGTIVFDRNFDAGLPSQANGDYQSQGYFTGCMFRIEGEGIAEVAASIDRGQLYSYTAEEFVKSSDPDRWISALTWKPGKENEGVYGDYDYIQPQSTNDGLDRSDPNKLCRVALSTLLGSSTNLGTEQLTAMNDGFYSLGIWTNESYQETNAFSSVIDTLDGARLTITISFADGSTSTKVIELHSADMKTQFVPAEYGGTLKQQVTPETIDPSSLNPEDPNNDVTYVHSLYGTVVDEEYKPASANSVKSNA